MFVKEEIVLSCREDKAGKGNYVKKDNLVISNTLSNSSKTFSKLLTVFSWPKRLEKEQQEQALVLFLLFHCMLNVNC